jgi:hypothetical protein
LVNGVYGTEFAAMTGGLAQNLNTFLPVAERA